MAIMDSLISMLLQRVTVYSSLSKKIVFLARKLLVFHCFLCFIGEIFSKNLCSVAENLVESYPEDLKPKLEMELVHFSAF